MNLLSQVELEFLTEDERAEYIAALERISLAQEQQQLADLASFSRAAWTALEPATPLVWNWHLDLICEYLTLCRDRVIRRLIINVPPQTMKSRLVTVFYPSWSWVTVPSRRFMAVSYSGGDDGLSTLHSMERRKVLASPWFQNTFPGVVSFATKGKEQFENSVGGRMIATSTGGTATGKGVHDIILDDLINPKQAESDPERTKATEFIDSTLRSRLSDQVTGVIICVEQRTHEEDATGHLLAKEPGKWVHVKLPMEAEEDERWTFPISGRIVERKAGDLLWPARFPKTVCESLKIGMGARTYTGQYQQRPTPAGGAIIKRHWLRYWNKTSNPLPEKFDGIGISWDMSFKDTKESSRVSGQLWAWFGARRLLLDGVCGLMDFVQTQKAVVNLQTRVALYAQRSIGALRNWVEDKANGPAIISSLKDIVPGLIAIPVKDSKEARMFAVSPFYEAGNVEYPDPGMPGYEWVNEHVEEILRFPNKPNDRGDAESQALDQMRQTTDAFSRWMEKDHDKREAERKTLAERDRNSGGLNSLIVPRRTQP